MYCHNCGNEIPEGAKFCLHCGQKVSGTQNAPKKIQLRCKNCNGIMTPDEEHEILTCPYCGSKELITDSDTVAVEKVKTRAYKEIELQKLQNEKEMAEHQEELKDKETYKKSKLRRWTVIMIVVSSLGLLSSFSTGFVLAGIVAFIQLLAFVGSLLIGSGHIRKGPKGLHAVLAVTGFVLIVVYFIAFMGAQSSFYKKQMSDLNYTEEAEIEEKEPEAEQKKPAASEPVKEDTVKEDTVTEETGVKEPALTGIRPEFQKAMDEYEEFMDKYCAFMEKYAASSDPTSMLLDYGKIMEQYMEFADTFDKLGEEEMSDEETALYLEVQTRVNQKLVQTAGGM